MRVLNVLILFLFLFVFSFYFMRHSPAPAQSLAKKYQVIAQGLEHPWGLAFLHTGEMLVSERAGRLRIVTLDGNVSEPISGVPEVYAEGQGGLLDVIAGLQHDSKQRIYFSFAEREGGRAGTAVASATLDGLKLEEVKVIFRQTPKVEGEGHFGSRLALDSQGTIFVTLGDRMSYADNAQTLDNTHGKIVRVNAIDGSIPSNNPYKGKNALPEIWSYGHRNVQGAEIHPHTGKLWVSEHGPRGGDEINIVEAGKNYGWPLACYGSHYSGEEIPDAHESKGFAEPLYYWNPSIAPSGMAFYVSNKVPTWTNSLFVGALAGQHLVRLQLDGERVINEEKLLEAVGRIRDVAISPEGEVYVITDDSDGKILKLLP